MLWPLFTGGRIDAAQDIRQAQVSEAEQLLVLKQQSTFESLSQTYFGVVLAAQVVQTKQEIEQGTGTPSGSCQEARSPGADRQGGAPFGPVCL